MNQQQQPQDFERFEHQVEDMYNVLLNISSELLTIKSMMKVNRKLATEQHQHETINEGNNCKYVPILNTKENIKMIIFEKIIKKIYQKKLTVTMTMTVTMTLTVTVTVTVTMIMTGKTRYMPQPS